MQKRDLPYLVFGILITTVAACRSTTILPGPGATLEPEWASTAPATPLPVTGIDPPAATAPAIVAPATTPDDGRQTLGSERAGLSLRIPAGWSDLTTQTDIPAMGNRLGINLVFAADSERTGRSLLAGKAFDGGAYVSGLLVTPDTTAADPVAALSALLSLAAPTAVRLTEPVGLVSANDVAGVMLDVADGPIGLSAAAPNDLRTRVVLFTPAPAEDNAPSGVILLLSASADRWPQIAPLFDEMLATARVGGSRPGAVAQAGNVVVRGRLQGDRAQVSAALEAAVSDLWTFAIDGQSYVSLFLQANEPQLDPALTLLGPDRQTVLHIDNGYEGATESVTDLLLTQAGSYLVQISDFYHTGGGYSLSFVLATQPQFAGGGPIAFGQALQGELPANGRHYWVFAGTAQQRVSIVVEPQVTAFDAVLDLYGPDGRRVVALDEGFGGDPEIMAGFELPATGEYAILVRSFTPQGGPYTLSLDDDTQSIANFYDAGDLTYGDVRPETLQPQEAHAWFLQGRSGDHVLIRVTPLDPNLDPDVWLLDAGLERVAAQDAYAAGDPETIELTLTADGQYVVLVRDFNGEPGTYEIALGAAPIATPENAGALSYGDTIIGVIRPGTAVAWSFSAQAGDVIQIDVTPAESSSDIVLQLRGPDGLTALEVDAGSAGAAESVAAFVVSSAGTWHIVLREYFGATTNYRLALERGR